MMEWRESNGCDLKPGSMVSITVTKYSKNMSLINKSLKRVLIRFAIFSKIRPEGILLKKLCNYWKKIK